MTARAVRFAVVVGSAPEGWDKRRQLPPARRARALRRIINTYARQARREHFPGEPVRAVAGLFETGSRMRRVVRRWPVGWRFTMGTPNNRIRGLVRGNGLLSRGVRVRLADEIPVDVGRRTLHFPIVTAPDLGVAFVVGHRETRRADPGGRGRRAAEYALRDAVVELVEGGWEVVVMVDWNGGEPLEWGPGSAYVRPLHRRGVDWCLGTAGVRVIERTLEGPGVHEVTDHGHLLALVLEVTP